MEIIVSLIVIAFVLFFFEVFLPSGIVGGAGVLCILVASALMYEGYGLFPALGVFLGGAPGAVLMFFAEADFLKHSRFGKIFLHQDTSTGQSNAPAGEPELVGATGSALTPMAPSGKITVNGKVYAAASASGLIEKDAPVKVIRVEAFNVVVEPVQS